MRVVSRWLLVLSSFMVALPSWAQSTSEGQSADDDAMQIWNEFRQDALKGLRCICVMVQTDDGVLKSTLLSEIELGLRQIGLNVVPVKPRPTCGLLVVSVILLGDDDSARKYSVECQLSEYVSLARDRSRVIPAITWSLPEKERWLYRTGKQEVIQEARDELDGMMKTFLNDWLAANPERGASKQK